MLVICQKHKFHIKVPLEGFTFDIEKNTKMLEWP